MAEVIWTIPALNDLEGILEYIALDKPAAANSLAKRVFDRVDRLAEFPCSGTKPRELKRSPYRRLVVGPILIYHRHEGSHVCVVHVSRAEKQFDLRNIEESEMG
jgi:plasmid stabilization system protein ParE